jgi:hypothetical protein
MSGWKELSNALSFGGTTRKTKPGGFPKPKNIDVTKAHEIRLNARCHNDHMRMLGDTDVAKSDYFKSRGDIEEANRSIGRVYVCGIHEVMMYGLQSSGKYYQICEMCKDASR